MTSKVSQIAIAHERSRERDRVDAYGLACRGRVVVVASAPDPVAAEALVRRVVESTEPTASIEDAFARVRRIMDTSFASTNHDPCDLLVASFAEFALELASRGVRCFRMRSGAFERLTGDDPSIVQASHEIRAGDAYAICTAGVHGTVTESTIRAALRNHYHPRDVAHLLLDVARRGHPSADMTAIVIRPSIQSPTAAT